MPKRTRDPSTLPGTCLPPAQLSLTHAELAHLDTLRQPSDRGRADAIRRLIHEEDTRRRKRGYRPPAPASLPTPTTTSSRATPRTNVRFYREDSEALQRLARHMLDTEGLDLDRVRILRRLIHDSQRRARSQTAQPTT